MTANTQAQVQLQAFEDALLRFQDGSMTASELSVLARSSQVLLTALPERYGTVLLQLLDRLESGALFTEESCSFSQTDLHHHLQGWIAKASERLQTST